MPWGRKELFRWNEKHFFIVFEGKKQKIDKK